MLCPHTYGNVFLRFHIVYCSQGNRQQQAMSWNNTKTQENVSVCTGPVMFCIYYKEKTKIAWGRSIFKLKRSYPGDKFGLKNNQSHCSIWKQSLWELTNHNCQPNFFSCSQWSSSFGKAPSHGYFDFIWPWGISIWVLERKGQKTFLKVRQLFAFISSAMAA